MLPSDSALTSSLLVDFSAFLVVPNSGMVVVEVVVLLGVTSVVVLRVGISVCFFVTILLIRCSVVVVKVGIGLDGLL